MKRETWSTVADLRFVLTRTGIRPRAMCFPIMLAVGASLCEGLTFMVLIPAIKGMITFDMQFALSIPVIGEIVRMIGVERSLRIVLLLVCATFMAAGIKTLLGYGAAVAMAAIVKEFTNSLRKLLYARFLTFGKLYYDRSNLGHLQQILTTYVSLLSGALNSIQGGVYAGCTLFVYCATMMYISWKLTLLIFAAFPLLYVALRRLVAKIERTSLSFIESYNDLGKKISNSLSSIPLVKAYNNEAAEQRLFSHTSDCVRALEFSIERKTLLVGPIQDLILLCFLFAIVGIIAYICADEGSGGIARYAVFLLALKRAGSTFGIFTSIHAAFAGVRGAFSEVMAVFDDEKKFFVPDGEREFLGLKNSILIRQLDFDYPDGVRALKDVSFSIERGKVTAVVGRTGSGKSTIMNLLMRFYDCPPSSILVDGTDIREFQIPSWRKEIAMVSQDTLLFHESLRFNITYGIQRDVSEEEIRNVLERARLAEFVHGLPNGLETEIGDRGIMLSGGERQRVSIARAMLKQSEILLLDEATSALDSVTERSIQEALDELMRGKTSVIIAHRLSTIRHADWIVVLEQGRIVEQESFTSLLAAKGYFHRYWQEQRV